MQLMLISGALAEDAAHALSQVANLGPGLLGQCDSDAATGAQEVQSAAVPVLGARGADAACAVARRREVRRYAVEAMADGDDYELRGALRAGVQVVSAPQLFPRQPPSLPGRWTAWVCGPSTVTWLGDQCCDERLRRQPALDAREPQRGQDQTQFVPHAAHHGEVHAPELIEDLALVPPFAFELWVLLAGALRTDRSVSS